MVYTNTCILLHVQVEGIDSEESDEDFCEGCFHCGKNIPVSQLRTHLRQCSAMLVVLSST